LDWHGSFTFDENLPVESAREICGANENPSMMPVRNVFLSTEVGETSRFDCMSIIDGRERFERIEVLMVDDLSLVST
jgi:hypothetical protein